MARIVSVPALGRPGDGPCANALDKGLVDRGTRSYLRAIDINVSFKDRS